MADTVPGAVARTVMRMFRSDDRLETYLAIAIMGIVGFIVWTNIARSVPESG